MSARTGLAQRRSPLPTVLTPLLGRRRESQQLRDLLLDPAIRLVTLTGPGGVGKTRLALHVAESLLDELEDEVVFVPLTPVREPELVLPAIGQAIGLLSDAQAAYEEQVIEALRDQRMVLLLDNVEQVRDAAPLLAILLGRCRGITMLATSQAALNIAGEQLYPLAPLPTPTSGLTRADEIARTDAVALFLHCARAANPHLVLDDRALRTIGEICRQLDGLPLAIELAAARTTVLSPEALLARLSSRLQVLGGTRRDVPDRLRTMRNAVAWSYELLRPDEQALFRRLAVFVDGFALDAAEAIFLPGDDARDAVDVLSTLVDHSLVRAVPQPLGEVRFRMLETLRAYGLEQLQRLDQEADARLAHAAFMADLSEKAGPRLVGREQARWRARIDAERENIRAAIDWSLAHGHGAFVQRIGEATWRFLAAWSGTEEAKASVGQRSYLEQALRLAMIPGAAVDESRALMGLGIIAHERGEHAAAMEFHHLALALARESGDQRRVAVVAASLAAVSYYQGKLDDAERSWQESHDILAALGDGAAGAMIAANLGELAAERGDLERGVWWLQRAVEGQRQFGLGGELSHTLVRLGNAYDQLGDEAHARRCVTEALAILRMQGDPRSQRMIEALARRLGNAGTTPKPRQVPSAAHALTARELEVLRLLAQGRSTREIAEALFISPRTAGTHANNILRKLGVPSRTAAVAYALRTGLV